MRRKSPKSRRTDECGFTIIEAMIYLVVALVVGTSIFQLFISQNKLYMKERELMDVRRSLRGATALLSWELRQASSVGGDLYKIGANALALWSIQGTAVICGEKSGHYGLSGMAGEFDATADDSALVYAAGDRGTDDDRWKLVKVDRYVSPAAGGVATCFWGDTLIGPGKLIKGDATGSWTGSVVPDRVVQIQAGMDSVVIGAQFRAFRRVEYGLHQEDGRWWLGRRVGSSATYEKLTGPLRSPSDGGLVFSYYDRAGNTTADPTRVAEVEILLRAESFAKVRRAGGREPAFQQDSLRTRVSLRG